MTSLVATSSWLGFECLMSCCKLVLEAGRPPSGGDPPHLEVPLVLAAVRQPQGQAALRRHVHVEELHQVTFCQSQEGLG